MKLIIYTIDYKYVEFLRTIDPRIPKTKFKTSKYGGRRYVGIVFEQDDTLYFAPMTSQIWKDAKKTILKNNPTDILLKDVKNQEPLVHLKWIIVSQLARSVSNYLLVNLNISKALELTL